MHGDDFRLSNKDLLIVGLGNPGPDYAGTRHNLGLMCVESLAVRLGVALTRRRWRSRLASAPLTSSGQVWLMAPQTYMNLSGRAVADAVRALGLPTSSVWIVHDEMDIPLCRLRIRREGSDAGHNGVASIMAALRTAKFARFRVGVGRPPSPRLDPIDYLLSPFSRKELALLPTVRAGVADALMLAMEAGLDKAMEVYNRPSSLGCAEVA